LAEKLDAIRPDLAAVGFKRLVIAPQTADAYEDAFRLAGLGQVDDDPQVVAQRILASNIPEALVAALDRWSVATRDEGRRSWLLNVARRADRDPTGWRDRARDDSVWNDEAALTNLVATAPVADQPVSLLLAIEQRMTASNPQRILFLKRIQQAHPGDFWINLTLGGDMFALDKREEAIAYFRAALAVRPKAAFVHTALGAALFNTGRQEEAFEHLRRATELDGTNEQIQVSLAAALKEVGRYDEALERMPEALRAHPTSIPVLDTFGSILAAKGRHDEELGLYRRALEIDPTAVNLQRELRIVLLRQRRAEEARAVWAKALEADPPEHDAWYGYAELCLFLGHNEEYRRARQALLAKFGASTDPRIAERTARACLLLPASGDELRQAVALAERAAAADRAKYGGFVAYFQFVEGLAEYRQGRFDRAISMMRGDASHVLGPAPRLVLSMALHQSGQTTQARETLAAAIASHDWSPKQVRDQDGWIYGILRREAESMILPNLPAFLSGQHHPEDNDERLALLGVCQFTSRTSSCTRLYTAAFTADARLAEVLATGRRYNATCAAALADCRRGDDATNLAESERARWRDQARQWLRADLAARGTTL
jgi:eukaryotic-like serine/threonine-protein kinase